VALYKGSWAQF